MDIVELLLDRLDNVDDVVPFLSVSEGAKYFAERRICEITLQASRSEDYAELIRLWVKLKWKIQFAYEPWVEMFSVLASEVLFVNNGWSVRFQSSRQTGVPVADGHELIASILTPHLSSWRRQILWRGNLGDMNTDTASLPDATWNFEERMSGKFTRNFRSGLSICYQVSEEGPATDVLLELSKARLALPEGASDNDSCWWSDDEPGACEWDWFELSNKYKWLREDLSLVDDPELFVYHLLHMDIPVAFLLKLWKNWTFLQEYGITHGRSWTLSDCSTCGESLSFHDSD